METGETPVIKEKPTEELAIPPPLRKRRKLYNALDFENGDPLNDVTSVSGIDLQEEQEGLFYEPTNRPSPMVAQVENEEAIILQKIPLFKKLELIMSKCGITNMGSDIEHCLSLGVEAIMHRLIHNMIRVSKKRLDFEKTKHEICVTSEIRHHIGLMSQNFQYREKGGKDQGVEVERVANKTVQAAATNAAARTAVGGQDLLAKWHLMAQKGSQRQGTNTRPTTGKVYWLSQTFGRSVGHLESHEGTENAGRGDIVEIPQKAVNVVANKDVIAVLEKEPQFSKSTTTLLLA